MKKAISISLICLILTALLHISVAVHYCGGEIAASKISLSGKLASCGMENINKEVPFSGPQISKHCCDNVLNSYGIYSLFFGSSFTVIESHQQLIQIFSIPADMTIPPNPIIKSICTNVNPPGLLTSNSVDLADICVLRI
jgi:hypothetical protein